MLQIWRKRGKKKICPNWAKKKIKASDMENVYDWTYHRSVLYRHIVLVFNS